MTFLKKLDAIINNNESLLCVGLDSDIDKIPHKFNNLENPQFEFNKFIINQTFNYVCAYKPNTAFYEAKGTVGIEQLKLTLDYLHDNCPQIPVILDAKRGDIGNTNQGYINFAYNYLEVDAITLHPYLGFEAIQPFLDIKEKGSIILCKTSNPGGGEFQDLRIDGIELYKIIAKKAAILFKKHANILLVLGATYTLEIAIVREIIGDMTLLVPGIGAQGGDVKKTVLAGLNSKKKGIIINSSRDIIFSENPEYEVRKLRDEINLYR
ncbi:orotidine-5'-phosphate decarboxylase [Candidatus Roizmanbacteria bacterium CG_4_10_14_0_2_um_filter_36_9]|uniref:Orotidine-5'-phosphate decarboxylase n=1 Tax=Candidatus Roizmanbacteria bacterium CG_4_10_14_0_2_um_filter_36_9 TaxID=1974823 RepID=A0A2M7U4K0_9BACT|nr:MAG: orotidine-5'-phosphate decarboxylase [Candidatus Roizmanbacteria bacterium CG_4_10_14_0_2_um_filter_36_9]